MKHTALEVVCKSSVDFEKGFDISLGNENTDHRIRLGEKMYKRYKSSCFKAYIASINSSGMGKTFPSGLAILSLTTESFVSSPLEVSSISYCQRQETRLAPGICPTMAIPACFDRKSQKLLQ